MGVPSGRKVVAGRVTNYSSLSAALFLRAQYVYHPWIQGDPSLEGTEFLASIHHKAAATMLTTSFRHVVEEPRAEGRGSFCPLCPKVYDAFRASRPLTSIASGRKRSHSLSPFDPFLRRVSKRLNSRVIIEIYKLRRAKGSFQYHGKWTAFLRVMGLNRFFSYHGHLTHIPLKYLLPALIFSILVPFYQCLIFKGSPFSSHAYFSPRHHFSRKTRVANDLLGGFSAQITYQLRRAGIRKYGERVR